MYSINTRDLVYFGTRLAYAGVHSTPSTGVPATWQVSMEPLNRSGERTTFMDVRSGANRAKDDVVDQWVAGTLLSRLDPPTRTALLRIAPARRFRKGDVLLAEGDRRGTHAFVLRAPSPDRSACVKVTARLADGREALLGIRLSGDIVGELGALHRQPRSATVTACSDVWAHTIQGEALLGFLQRHPQAWLALNATIADRLEWANRRRLDFAEYPVAVRLSRILLLLADRHGRPTADGRTLGVALSHEELGMLIGARKDAVYQAVHALRQEGRIATAYRSIVIVDEDGLRRVADAAAS